MEEKRLASLKKTASPEPRFVGKTPATAGRPSGGSQMGERTYRRAGK